MEINYDVWVGEGIESIIQTIAEFRLQVMQGCPKVNELLSEEINALTHYFDDEAIIIVANDGGRFVGYISAVNLTDYHQNFLEYSNFGSEIKVSQGPIVHSMYRNMGIASELIREMINECQIRDLELFCIDPISDQTIESGSLNEYIVSQFNFETITVNSELGYKKKLIETIE
mgnify:CR=1 FL=1